MTTTEKPKYEWTENMGEISGFGGSYEAACRAMVIAGMEWWDANPDADPQYKTPVTGDIEIVDVCIGYNADAEALDKVMTEAADKVDPNGGMTGAMHEAAVSHIYFAHKNGWDVYQEKLRERDHG